MSNILFVLYHDFSANSAVHVHNFANQLASFGHSVAVAIPKDDDTGAALGEQHYSVARYDEVDGDWNHLFTNGLHPDILHAWTPRENVRIFCEKIRDLCPVSLFVHLEDNEEVILEANLGRPFEELARSRTTKFPGNLAHPRNYRRFIAAADGVTMIMDRLDKFVPPDLPKMVLWPGADPQLFFAQEKDETFLRSLGIPCENIVFCYTGNVHSANAREVRSLYLAAAILSREGMPTTLVRAGRDFCPFLGSDDEWARSVSVDLGYVKHVDIPRLLSLADFLIQPGLDDAFNEFRLPAKLPEFFAAGRPVLLPLTNLGRFVCHGQHAWVSPKMDALAIVDAIRTLQADQELVSSLAAGSLTFCQEHFSWKKNTAKLENFYEQLRANEPSWTHVPSSAVS